VADFRSSDKEDTSLVFVGGTTTRYVRYGTLRADGVVRELFDLT
jgi:hypothetical protein